MKCLLLGSLFMSSSNRVVEGFVVLQSTATRQVERVVTSSSLRASTAPTTTQEEKQTLGLITFDLDDTLYPIEKVEQAANQAFVKAMDR